MPILVQEVDSACRTCEAGHISPEDICRLAASVVAAVAHGLKAQARSLWSAILHIDDPTVSTLARLVDSIDCMLL